MNYGEASHNDESKITTLVAPDGETHDIKEEDSFATLEKSTTAAATHFEDLSGVQDLEFENNEGHEEEQERRGTINLNYESEFSNVRPD